MPLFPMNNVRKTMKRNIFNKLEKWKKSSGRKPLVLLGARQVGKTYSLKQFGKEHFRDMLYINLETEPAVHPLFKGSLDPYTIIKNLEIYYNTTVDKANTLIIFDEIQESPEALTSLKYFCENAPDYYIATAGSLLGLKTKRSKGFPVGKVNFLSLYPLSFFEFLQAIDQHKLTDYLKSITTFEPLSEPIHERALNYFKTYLYIGGMPEAVQHYALNENLLEIRNIQNEIIKAYEFDFAKHAPSELVTRITEVWYALPRNLAKENKKFIFSAIREGARAREYDAAVQWLLDAKLIYRAINIAAPRLPLPAYSDNSAFKLYMNDVGLLGALSHLESRTVLQGDAMFTEFKGALIENFVATNLAALSDDKLYYWTSGNTAEIDFITDDDGRLYPLEVKSGSSNKKKSLAVYDERNHPEFLHRTSPMNLRCDGRVCNYPLYLMESYPLKNEDLKGK
jgi:predicted AAA+ superfamily ATPase